MSHSHFEITQRQFAINEHAIVAITNLKGNILYVNDRFCKISKYTKEEIIGKNHRLFNSGYHSSEFFAEIYSTLKNGDAWQGEIRNITKDGNIYWLATTIVPLKNAEGKIERYFAVRTDITAKKQIEEELKNSELRFHAIFDQAPVGIALVESRTGKYIQINPKFCEILGYDAEEIINKRYLDITHPEDMKISLDHWQTLLDRDTKFPFFEKRYIRKDGSIVWTNLTCVRLFGREEGFSYHLVIIMDITESKKANETLRKYMHELENVNQTKDKFFSIIAHDLRNPFAGIIGITELLDSKMREELINESMKLYHKYVQMVQVSAQSAFTLLENLLQWARSQTGDISVRPKNTSLAYLLSYTIPIVSGNAFKKNITIEQDLGDNEIVYADESLVSTILRNLLTNSIKFTPANGKITLSTQSKKDFLEISIVDTGVGIDPENLKKIFRIDSKFSKPGTNNEKGTGLGLILCKEFIEKQGGNIWIESQLGKGSKVTFTLPLGR